jgi:hypothetical protein
VRVKEKEKVPRKDREPSEGERERLGSEKKDREPAVRKPID